MVDFFIQRPVFATVCALLIILAGAVCIPTLPISLYPNLAPPQVTVTSNYVGANAQVVESAVTIPLEQQINGVEGMHYITSTSSNDGTSNINVIFRTGYDLNIAAVDVQNRVATATGPAAAGDQEHRHHHHQGEPEFRFRRRVLFARWQPLGPVHLQLPRRLRQGRAEAHSRRRRRDHLRRAQVRHAHLARPQQAGAARQLTAADVVSALQEQNVEIPAGQLGQAAGGSEAGFPDHAARRRPAFATRGVREHHPEEHAQRHRAAEGRRARRDRLRELRHQPDVQRPRSRRYRCSATFRTPTRWTWTRRRKPRWRSCRSRFRPGIKYVIAFDTTTVVGDSVREVVTTLEEAIIIVIVVIFLFLLDWRATIIPAVTIPVSLIGTFAFIKVFGFSINSLTLFGITLATGLVVDDAIVVIENVQRHISDDKTDPHTATSVAMKEVTGAVVATSLVLISVFVPVSFFPGTTGILYKQFSLTIAFAIAISLFNALTLSPALAAILLRGEEHKYNVLDWTHIGWLSRRLSQHSPTGSTAPFTAWARPTAAMIRRTLKIRYVMVVLFCRRTGGYRVSCTVTCPRASCRRRTRTTSSWWCRRRRARRCPTRRKSREQAEKVLLADPDVFGTFAVPGFSLSGGSSSNYGLVFAPLKPIDSRKGEGHSASGHRGACVAQAVRRFRAPSWWPSSRRRFRASAASADSSSRLQDLGRNTLQDLDNVAHKIVVQSSRQRKDLTGLFTSFTANDPQQLVQIDREKAKAMGVPLQPDHAGAGRVHGIGSTSTISTSTIVRTACTCRPTSRSA